MTLKCTGGIARIVLPSYHFVPIVVQDFGPLHFAKLAIISMLM
jgi:hypothetical protein